MRRLLSVLSLCAALAAQEPVSPFRFVPADSCLVVRVGAPARWKEHFKKTQVAKLFSAQTLAPLVQQAAAAIDAGMEKARSSGKMDVDVLQRFFADYKGEMVMSLQIDFAALPAAIESGDGPPISAVIALAPDGSFDLAALATAIEKSIEAEIGDRHPITDLVVGEHRLRASINKDGMPTTLPAMIDGHFVMVMSHDLDQNAARLLGTADRFTGKIDGRPLFVHAKLEQAMEALMKAVAARMDAQGAPFDVVQMLRSIGLGSLHAVELALGAEDKHVVGELDLTLGDGERGLLGMAMFEQGSPKLLRCVPASAESFSVRALDLGAAFRTIATIWGAMGDAVPMTFDQVQTAFTEATKVRLKEDLVDHLGTELLMVGDVETPSDASASEDLEQNPAAAMFRGSCFGISLRDGKAFGESLEKVIRSRGLHAGRKSEDYLDSKIHRLRLAAVVELEYVVTDDLLLLVIGNDESSRRNLRAVLDARARKDATLPAAVQTHLAAMPAGWSSVTLTPMAQTMRSLSTAFTALQQVADAPEGLSMVIQVMQGLAGDMKRLGIENMVGATYTTARSYVSRFRW